MCMFCRETNRGIYMNNAKIENMLNLALDASPGEREKSLQLGVGFSPEEQTWEVIVRFVRDGLAQVRTLLSEQGHESLLSKITALLQLQL